MSDDKYCLECLQSFSIHDFLDDDMYEVDSDTDYYGSYDFGYLGEYF